MNLRLTRFIFVCLSSMLALFLADAVLISSQTPSGEKFTILSLSLLAGFLSGVMFVGLEIILSKRMASVLPSIVAGIVLGILTAGLVENFLTFFAWYRESIFSEVGLIFFSWLFIYVWSLFIIQTRDTFKVSIPYVDFKRQGRGSRPFILDAGVLIDGRFSELTKTELIKEPLVVPNFVLRQVQALAESSEKHEQQQGKRGLEQLKELRSLQDVQIDEGFDDPTHSLNQKLAQVCQKHEGILVSTDANLCQVLSLQDRDVLNLNEIANSLRPTFISGDKTRVSLSKKGESSGQGVGYLPDGTMVVVENGEKKIGQSVTVIVNSVLQTSAGHMIFAELYE